VNASSKNEAMRLGFRGVDPCRGLGFARMSINDISRGSCRCFYTVLFKLSIKVDLNNLTEINTIIFEKFEILMTLERSCSELNLI